MNDLDLLEEYRHFNNDYEAFRKQYYYEYDELGAYNFMQYFTSGVGRQATISKIDISSGTYVLYEGHFKYSFNIGRDKWLVERI